MTNSLLTPGAWSMEQSKDSAWAHLLDMGQRLLVLPGVPERTRKMLT